jgi:hypothetical protein
MFLKFFQGALVASVTLVLSACGGGNIDDAAPASYATTQAPIFATVMAPATTQITQPATDAARVLLTAQTDPSVADDAARAQMAVALAAVETSLSMQRNAQQAELQAGTEVTAPMQQVYAPHQDCLDMRLAECAGTRRAESAQL